MQKLIHVNVEIFIRNGNCILNRNTSVSGNI